MMIKVYGVPAAKGSLHCVGSRGGRNHILVEQNEKKIRPWRDQLTAAGKAALAKRGPLEGPLVVSATFTVPRPASVTLKARPWPVTRSSGDSDKMLRLCLDALDTSGLYGDDAQIVTATTGKCYPDTPGAVDRLDRPGAVIRIEQIQ